MNKSATLPSVAPSYHIGITPNPMNTNPYYNQPMDPRQYPHLPHIYNQQTYDDLFYFNYGPTIIPQYKRLQYLQEKVWLLENRNIANNNLLNDLYMNDYTSHRRYPKYTIIQNTPLSSKDEIINQIFRSKLNYNTMSSPNEYPSSIYKNQNEINQMCLNGDIKLKHYNNNTNHPVNNNNNIEQQKKQKMKRKRIKKYERVVFKELPSIKEEIEAVKEREMNKVNNEMMYKLQKENFELRDKLQEMNNKMEMIQESTKLAMKDLANQQLLTVDKMKQIILKGGDKKLKASMFNVLDKKHYNVWRLRCDEEKEKKEIKKLIELNKEGMIKKGDDNDKQKEDKDNESNDKISKGNNNNQSNNSWYTISDDKELIVPVKLKNKKGDRVRYPRRFKKDGYIV